MKKLFVIPLLALALNIQAATVITYIGTYVTNNRPYTNSSGTLTAWPSDTVYFQISTLNDVYNPNDTFNIVLTDAFNNSNVHILLNFTYSGLTTLSGHLLQSYWVVPKPFQSIMIKATVRLGSNAYIRVFNPPITELTNDNWTNSVQNYYYDLLGYPLNHEPERGFYIQETIINNQQTRKKIYKSL